MTNNQLTYWRNKEEERHNRVTDEANIRNAATSEKNARINVAKAVTGGINDVLGGFGTLFKGIGSII